MRHPSTPLARTLIGLAFATLAGAAAAGPANPEPLDLDPDILATTQARQVAKAGKAGEKPAAECGAVSIGNVVGGGRIGFAPIDVNVVIVGDVINANNNCR
jgi:hypothetical protein